MLWTVSAQEELLRQNEKSFKKAKLDWEAAEKRRREQVSSSCSALHSVLSCLLKKRRKSKRPL